MNLPELYAKVCEKVSEANVGIQPFNTSTDWWSQEQAVCVSQLVAEALILQHWLGMLPRGLSLIHMSEKEPDMEWTVYDDMKDWYILGTTPIEALANYHLEKNV